MSRRNVHGAECPCQQCRDYYARQSPPPRVPTLPPLPEWTYSLSYALIQVGDFFRVLSSRYAPPPATAASEGGEDEDDIASRAAAGEFNR